MFLKKALAALSVAFLVFTSTPVLQAGEALATPDQGVVYSVDENNAIWEVDIASGVATKVNDTTIAGYSNALAYDTARDHFFFMNSDNAFSAPLGIYYWNRLTTGPTSVPSVASPSQFGSPATMPANAAFHNNAYWFVSGTVLNRITFAYAADGTPTSPVRSTYDLALYAAAPGGSVFSAKQFGDIAITPSGMLYGSVRPTGEFFSVDLTLLGSTSNVVYRQIMAPNSGFPGYQITFNQDFTVLYGHNSTDGTWHTINVATGAATALGFTTALFTDLAGASSTRAAAGCSMNSPATLNNQSARVGAAVANAPAVTVVDSLGVPVPNVDVTFTVTSGGGSVGGGQSATVKTDLIGVATAPSWVLGASIGANTLSAASGNLCSVLFQATGTQPGISLSKALTGTAPVKAGDATTWNLIATNTGTVALTSVTITDSLTGDTKACGTLTVSAVCTLSVTYPATQADIDAGVINNSATVVGTAPEGDVFSASANAQTSIVPSPSVSLVKLSDVAAVPVAGDTVVYDFVATNTGNVTLSGVSISDPFPGLGAMTCSPAQPATLNPGEILSCRANYALTQANIDAGKIVNNASVSGRSPSNVTVSNSASKETMLGQSPNMSFVKTASFFDPPQIGDVVDYTFEATNTGNVTLSNATIVDALEGLSDLVCSPVQPATLSPGGKLACTAEYAITQPDIDLATLTNKATITAVTPAGETVSLEAEIKIDIPQNPAVSLEKKVKILESPTLGKPIVYEVVATNIGDVTLNNVLIVDSLPGATVPLCNKPQPAVLEVEEQLVCEITYLITSQDIFNGYVRNTAEVIGNSPFGIPVGGEASTETVIPNSPSFLLTKQVKSVDDSNGTGVTDPGDLITWTITIVNEGDVPLQRVSIYDDLIDQTVECGVVQPKESCVAESFYTVRQIDGRNGAVINNATGTAYDQIGTMLTATVQNVVPVANPAPPIIPASLMPVEGLDGASPLPVADVPTTFLPQTGGVPLHMAVTGAVLLLAGSLLAIRNKKNLPLIPPPEPLA